MSDKPSGSTEWWERIAVELRAVRDEQRSVFADLPADLLERYLADDLRITVVEIRGDKVRLGIDQARKKDQLGIDQARKKDQVEVREAAKRNPELREALDDLVWALAEPAALPGEIPVVPRPLFAGRIEVARIVEPSEKRALENDEDQSENDSAVVNLGERLTPVLPRASGRRKRP